MRTQLLSVLVSVIVVCRPPPSVIIAVRSPSWPTRIVSRHSSPAPGTGFNEQTG